MKYQEIMLDINQKDKIYYVSGYCNPKFSKRALENTKPVQVQMKLFSELYPHIAENYVEHVIPVLIKKGIPDTECRIYDDFHEIFLTEIESVDYYNKCIDDTIASYDAHIAEIKKGILKNKI